MMQQTTWRGRRGGGGGGAGGHSAANTRERGRPATRSAQGAVSVRHIYDVLRLSGPVLLERASALLGLELPRASHPTPGGGGGTNAPRMTGIARRMQGVLQRPPPPPTAAAPQLPSLTLVLAAADTLQHLATTPPGNKNYTSLLKEGEEKTGSAVATLARLVAWYCLATTQSVGGVQDTQSAFHSSTASSAGGVASVRSGQSTPHSGSHTPAQTTPETCGNSDDKEAVNTNNSNNNNTSRRAARDTEDWFGSRMSHSTGSSSCATPNSATTATTSTLPPHSTTTSNSNTAGRPVRDFDDAQLAAQLVRPAVYAVARYSTYGLDSIAAHITQASEGAEQQEQPPLHVEDRESEAGRVRESVLWLLAAVLTRFPCIKWDWSAILPPLFPSVDIPSITGHRKGRRGQRHPLLTPMLCEAAPGVRQAACLVVAELLRKSNRLLRHAAEAEPGRQLAFASLASQAGEVLRQLHEALDWGLAQGQPACRMTCEGTPRNDDDDEAAAKAEFVEGLLFTYATLVASTPYQSCPRSQQVLLHTLQLPVLRRHLNVHHTPAVSDSRGAAQQSTADSRVTSMEHNATMHFLVQVLNNEWLIDPISALLLQSPPNTDEVTTATSNVSNNDNDDESSEGGQDKEGEGGKEAPALPWLSLVDGLLACAMSGTEAWSCVVQLARVYPSVVQAHFDALLRAGTELIARYVQQTLQPRITSNSVARPAQATTASHAKYVPPSQRNKHVDASAPVGVGETTQPSAAAAAATAATTVIRVSAEAVAMSLRGWLHFMGYTWHAFDEKPKDPAFRPAARAYRATLTQKAAIHASLLQPLLHQVDTLMHAADAEEVLVMLLRCVAQIGQDFVATELTAPAARAEMVECALRCSTHWNSPVRAEAMTTMGMWLWQYPALDEAFARQLTDSAVRALREDSDALVRGKAAFVLSNATSRLTEPQHILRRSPHYVQLLCDIAVFALSEENDHTVRCHGARMMNFLFQVLTFEELIAALTQHDEIVAEGFLRLLLRAMQPARTEPKLRWNCVFALGTALARVDVFEAEPRLALDGVRALTAAVEKDEAFKVRIQAANALAKLSCDCLARRFGAEDMTPVVVEALCAALVRAEQTENFQQYQDKDNLRAALKTALQVMITSAAPSNELAKVFAAHKTLLTQEELL